MNSKEIAFRILEILASLMALYVSYCVWSCKKISKFMVGLCVFAASATIANSIVKLANYDKPPETLKPQLTESNVVVFVALMLWVVLVLLAISSLYVLVKAFKCTEQVKKPVLYGWVALIVAETLAYLVYKFRSLETRETRA